VRLLVRGLKERLVPLRVKGVKGPIARPSIGPLGNIKMGVGIAKVKVVGPRRRLLVVHAAVMAGAPR
jgi:hypothetical protein